MAQGFAGTTADEICGKAKLTNGEELAVAVLTWSLKKGGEALADGPRSTMPAMVERIGRALRGFREHLAGLVALTN